MAPDTSSSPVHPHVALLLKIQKVDQEIASLRRDLDSLPEEQARRQRRLDALIEARDLVRHELQQAELSSRSLDNAIREADQQIAKIQEQLTQIKNNAEYQALLFRIESIKDERDKKQEQGLTLLDSIEALKGRLTEEQAKVDEEQAVFDEFVAEAEKLKAEREEQVAKVAEKKGTMEEEVPPDVLDLYKRLFESRQSLAVAAVEGQICQGCFTQVTMNDLAKLMGGSQVIRCGSCQRILYLP